MFRKPTNIAKKFSCALSNQAMPSTALWSIHIYLDAASRLYDTDDVYDVSLAGGDTVAQRSAILSPSKRQSTKP
jgi:hypothetical protein